MCKTLLCLILVDQIIWDAPPDSCDLLILCCFHMNFPGKGLGIAFRTFRNMFTS